MAARILVRGRVQGVGFRYAAVEAAAAIGVAGWVRNRADGAVEIFAQGTAEQVERMRAWARRGPPAARVGALEEAVPPPEPEPALAAFELRPTA